MNSFLRATLALFVLTFACENEEIKQEPNQQITSEQVISVVFGDSGRKTWEISSAILNNDNVNNLDVSAAFNIQDDEFIFTKDGDMLTLTHRQRNEINFDAENFNDFLFENNISEDSYDLILEETDGIVIRSTNGEFIFSYGSENLIKGQWNRFGNSRIRDSNNNGMIEFTLSVSESSSAPNALNFDNIASFTVEDTFLSSLGSVDFLASQSNNSLYITYKNSFLVGPGPTNDNEQAEVVLKYDVITSTFKKNVFFSNDFFTRRGTIYNNKLHVVGTSKINTYNLDLSGEPNSNRYNQNPYFTYFRYDTASIDNEIYIIGGNPNLPGPNANLFDKILKYNLETQQRSELATLPSYKTHAAVEIVDSKIYIFGGMQYFGGYETGESLSYIYDLNSNTFSSFDLPKPLNISYTTVVGNIIYVAGEIFTLDSSNSQNVIDKDIFLAAYNIDNGEFTEIQHNLDDSDSFSVILGITSLNGKLYVIYGKDIPLPNNEEGDREYFIYETAI